MEKNAISRKIKQLQNLQNSQFPILSVYLGDSEKRSPSTRLLISRFHSLIHKSLSEKEQRIFSSDLERIQTYLLELFNTRGKRSIVFFSAQNHLFEVFSFEFYLPPLAVVSNSPYLTPLTDAITHYEKYLVLLVDRKRARLFTVHFGEIQEHKDIFDGLVPKKVKHGENTWDAQDKIYRHIDLHLHRHLQIIVDSVNDFVKDKGIEFIVLGGHKDMFSKIKKHLPQPLRNMVIGEFISELKIPLNDIFLHSKRVVATLEQEAIQTKLERSLQ